MHVPADFDDVDPGFMRGHRYLVQAIVMASSATR